MIPEKIFNINISYYVASWVGAILLYFKMKTEGKAVIEFLPHLFGNEITSPVGKIAEVLIFSIIGAIIATILTIPSNPQQAIAAGLGWTGLLSAFTKDS